MRILVAEDEIDEHVEAERGEREVVVPDAQRREAERDPDREAQQRRGGQNEPEGHARLHQYRGGVGPDSKERRVPERNQAGVADREVEAHGGHHVYAP